MEYLPDPRTVIEDAHDREREERDLAERRKVTSLFKNFHRESKKRSWLERPRSL